MNISKQSGTSSIQKISIKGIFRLCFLITVLFSSCVRYQCITISSSLNQNETKEFMDETDTVRMNYSFKGEDFPITLTVFNKLKQPIYFDWKNSMVIFNGNQITDAFDHEGQVDSVAPLSSATITSNNLSDKFVPLSKQDKITDALIATSNGNLHIQQHVFTEETSPVLFRSVVAISTQKDLSSALLYDHPFWISSIYQTMDEALSLLSSDQFYMKKSTGFGTFMECTFGAILLVAIAAVTPQGQ